MCVCVCILLYVCVLFCSKVCGTPTPAEWPEVVNLPLFHVLKPRKIYRRRVKEEYARYVCTCNGGVHMYICTYDVCMYLYGL